MKPPGVNVPAPLPGARRGHRRHPRITNQLVPVPHHHAHKRRHHAKKRRHQAHGRHHGLTLPGPPAGSWILGGNDRYGNCAAVAAANSLLAVTGRRASGQDILALHQAACRGHDAGAAIADVLHALVATGLAGAWPGGFEELEDGEPLAGTGLIVGLALEEAQKQQAVWDDVPSPPWGLHAAVLAGGAVISWGREIPVTGVFLAGQVTSAWRVRWQGVPARCRLTLSVNTSSAC